MKTAEIVTEASAWVVGEVARSGARECNHRWNPARMDLS